MLPIILASTSSRRRDLLNQVAVKFTTLAVDIDEKILPNESPTTYIERMVATKARAACGTIKTSDFATLPRCLVITADTIGVMPQTGSLPEAYSILMKPRDQADAFAMWQKMSGTTHDIWTAVQLTLIEQSQNPNSKTDAAQENQITIVKTEQLLHKTAVTFIPLTEADMNDYWQSQEPQDKAGGYAIQGRGAAWVDCIHGSYSNVVGLPLAQTLAAIKRLQRFSV